MSKVIVDSLNFSYGDQSVVNNVSFTVEDGQFACLVGPSGSGKSTLLRLIAGLMQPSSGSITLGNKIVVSSDCFLPVEKRHVGLMFQQASLFPHLTVEQNIRFGIRSLLKEQQERIVEQLLRQVELLHKKHDYPHMLSGGEQQRIALARAIAPSPCVLLLDEPFANLDNALRTSLRGEVLALLKEHNITSIMVTHDPDEACHMSDYLVMFNKGGSIIQTGSFDAIYQNPENIEAASFFCAVNSFEIVCKNGLASCVLGDLSFCVEAPSDSKTLIVRPEGISVIEDSQKGKKVVVESVRRVGGRWLVSSLLNNTPVLYYYEGDRPEIGNVFYIIFSGDHYAVL